MSWFEQGHAAKLALAKLRAAVSLHEYEVTGQEADVLRRLRLRAVLKEQSAFLVTAAACFWAAGRRLKFRSPRVAMACKLALGWVGGSQVKGVVRHRGYSATAAGLLPLDSPIGAELEALIKESGLPAHLRQQLLSARSQALPGTELPVRMRITPPQGQWSEAALRELKRSTELRRLLLPALPSDSAAQLEGSDASPERPQQAAAAPAREASHDSARETGRPPSEDGAAAAGDPVWGDAWLPGDAADWGNADAAAAQGEHGAQAESERREERRRRRRGRVHREQPADPPDSWRGGSG